MKERDYIEDLKINPDALDVESVEQASLCQTYVKLAADAKRVAKRAHEKLKVIKSQIILKVNKDPETYLGKGVKVSDVKVEAFYRCDRDYKQAKDEWIDAEYKASILEGAAWNFKDRKDLIDFLIVLEGRSYFKGPSIPRDLSEEVKQHYAKRQQELEEQSIDRTAKRIERRSPKQ